MTSRLLVALVTSVALAALAGCAQDEPAAPAGSPAATPSATSPSADPQAALVGSWRSEEADWTVHFTADGRFTEDFEGHEQFRQGVYLVDGDTVTLEGDDGQSTEGQLDGDAIEFALGVLQRQ